MMDSSFSDYLKTLPQYLIPQHFLSKLMFVFTRLKLGIVTHWFIRRFTNYYQVDMSCAQLPRVQDYASFNQFFTRALLPSARPLAEAEIISPVDGQISQIGKVQTQQLLQAKNHRFHLRDLFAGDENLAITFEHGLYCILYLSPRDYHRIHLPVAGQLTAMSYVPGRLFSVNHRTAGVVPNLYARNERIICLFRTEFGNLALILVGALFVGSIETVWSGVIPPNRQSELQHWQYDPKTAPHFKQGEEIGRFNMGSTVIMLLANQQLNWLPHQTIQNKVLMGQALAKKVP